MRIRGVRDIVGFLLLVAAVRVMRKETWTKYREMIKEV